MPAPKTLMRKENLDSVWGARSWGAGWASEARMSTAGVSFCWAFGFWLTLRWWVRSQSSDLSLSFFLAFALVSVASGPLSDRVRQTCPRGVCRCLAVLWLGAPPSHHAVFCFSSSVGSASAPPGGCTSSSLCLSRPCGKCGFRDF